MLCCKRAKQGQAVELIVRVCARVLRALRKTSRWKWICRRSKGLERLCLEDVHESAGQRAAVVWTRRANLAPGRPPYERPDRHDGFSWWPAHQHIPPVRPKIAALRRTLPAAGPDTRGCSASPDLLPRRRHLESAAIAVTDCRVVKFFLEEAQGSIDSARPACRQWICGYRQQPGG